MEKVKNMSIIEIFYFITFKGKCFISKIKPKSYAVISFSHFFFHHKSLFEN